MFKGKNQTGSKEKTVFSSLQNGLFTYLCAWEVEDGYSTASKFMHYRSLMVMTTNSQQRKWLFWFGSGNCPCTSQLPPGSVSNPWLPVDHMGERDPFLEQGVYCTGLWVEHTPQQMFTDETERCSDKRKCQPTAAPSSGVAGWAGWNLTVKSPTGRAATFNKSSGGQ